jgi:hypothetical protein
MRDAAVLVLCRLGVALGLSLATWSPLPPRLPVSCHAQDVPTFLSAFNSVWTTHCSQVLMIRNVFLYLDRTFVRDTPGTRSLW